MEEDNQLLESIISGIQEKKGKKMNQNKQHWEKVFSTKNPNEVSWTQEYPKTSIDYLENLNYYRRDAYWLIFEQNN